MSIQEVLLSAVVSQFVVLGDTHHSFVPTEPVSENMSILQEAGQEFFFLEHHYTLQPAIEAYRTGELSAGDFTEIAGQYSDDGTFGYTGYADLIMAATDAGLRVVAFDTRSTEALFIDPAFEVAPEDIVQYPQDLLGPIQAAYDLRDEMSFDQRSAEFVKTVTGEGRASIWIGNAHIHGGHQTGTSTFDFDGFLGEENTARVTMFINGDHYTEYMTQDLYGVVGLDCQREDQPDFMTFAEDMVGLATASAITKDFNVTNLTVVDTPAPCYTPDEPRIISEPALDGSGTP